MNEERGGTRIFIYRGTLIYLLYRETRICHGNPCSSFLLYTWYMVEREREKQRNEVRGRVFERGLETFSPHPNLMAFINLESDLALLSWEYHIWKSVFLQKMFNRTYFRAKSFASKVNVCIFYKILVLLTDYWFTTKEELFNSIIKV